MNELDTVRFKAEQLASSRRHILRFVVMVLVVGFVLLVVAIALQFKSSPLRVSKETTYITEPLKSDGKQVDYFDAIEQKVYPPNLATEENGYRLILERLVPALAVPRWHYEQTCGKLGLDLSRIHPDMTYQAPDDFIAQYVQTPENRDSVTAMVERLRARHRTETNAEDGASTEQGPASTIADRAGPLATSRRIQAGDEI